MQRIEVIEQASAHDNVRLGQRPAVFERTPQGHLIESFSPVEIHACGLLRLDGEVRFI
jgi:hypothetical protein